MHSIYRVANLFNYFTFLADIVFFLVIIVPAIVKKGCAALCSCIAPEWCVEATKGFLLLCGRVALEWWDIATKSHHPSRGQGVTTARGGATLEVCLWAPNPQDQSWGTMCLQVAHMALLHHFIWTYTNSTPCWREMVLTIWHWEPNPLLVGLVSCWCSVSQRCGKAQGTTTKTTLASGKYYRGGGQMGGTGQKEGRIGIRRGAESAQPLPPYPQGTGQLNTGLLDSMPAQ